jgi:hypothetical protein
MDRTERIFKIAVDIVLTIFFISAFNLFYHTWLVVPFSYLISHTINWLFNGQLFVLLKNLNLVYNDADVFRGWQSGVDCYLTKPFNPMELIAFVTRIFKSQDDDANGQKVYDLG